MRDFYLLMLCLFFALSLSGEDKGSANPLITYDANFGIQSFCGRLSHSVTLRYTKVQSLLNATNADGQIYRFLGTALKITNQYFLAPANQFNRQIKTSNCLEKAGITAAILTQNGLEGYASFGDNRIAKTQWRTDEIRKT